MKNKLISISVILTLIFTMIISVDAAAPSPRVDLNDYEITTADKNNVYVSGTVNMAKGQNIGLFDSAGKTPLSYTTVKNAGSSASFKIQVPAAFLKDGTNTFKVISLPVRGVLNASSPKTLTVKIGNSKQNQTITANDITVKVNEKKNLNARASSGLSLTYKPDNNGIATVDTNGNVIGRSVGQTKVTITQAGNASYNSVSKVITITVVSSASLNTPSLKGKSLYNNKVELSWPAISSATSYEVYCNDKKIATVKTNSYRHTKLKKNTTYKYKIRAIGASNKISNYSNVLVLKTKYREPVLLMVDNRSDNKRVPKAFKKYAGIKVVTVFSYDAIDPSKYDGLIIPGGNNITPSLYGEKKHPSTFNTNKNTDKLQIEAVKRFAAAKKPVLGLCRGNQIINVAFGGTIKQNLNLKNKKTVYHKKYHKVTNKKGYWMYSLFGKTKKTYQYHHQCVGKLGKGLVATSYSKGYKYKHIESIQHKTLPIYGIQWHPDSKIKETKSQKVFTGFKKICLDNMAK